MAATLVVRCLARLELTSFPASRGPHAPIREPPEPFLLVESQVGVDIAALRLRSRDANRGPRLNRLRGEETVLQVGHGHFRATTTTTAA